MFKKMFDAFKTRKGLTLLVVAIGAITYFMFLQKFDTVRAVSSEALDTISPFLWGGMVAYLLNPIVKFFERTIFRKLKKESAAHTLSVILTFVLSLALLALLMVAIISQIVSSFVVLVGNLEGYIASLQTTLERAARSIPFIDPNMLELEELIGSWEKIFTTVANWVKNNINDIIGVSYKVGNGVFNGVIALIFSVYVMLDKKKLKRLARRISAAILPDRPLKRFGEVVRKSNDIFLKYIGGSVVDSVIVGVANYIFMLIMGMPYALLISAINCVTNFIPNFGPFIGAVPSALILLLVDPWDAVWFVIFTIIMQFLDGNVVKPLLFSDSTGLSPVWVLVAIIVGGKMMGIVGMLIGIPLFAIISFVFDEWLAVRLKDRGFDEDGHRLKKKPDDPPAEQV